MNTDNQYLNDYVELYRDKKDEWLKDFASHHGTTSMFCREQTHERNTKCLGPIRKRPWYMLLKRDSISIESERKTKQINRIELMEGYVKHKLNKWVKRNPCPVKEDDLFYNEQYPVWKAQKDSAEEHIRDLVIAKYDKLQLVGRFRSSNELYKEQEIAQIKDNGETTKYGSVNNLPEHSKVIKMARKETNKVKAKRGNLVCTNLKDHRRKIGRILLPDANKQMEIAAQPILTKTATTPVASLVCSERI